MLQHNQVVELQVSVGVNPSVVRQRLTQVPNETELLIARFYLDIYR